MPKKLVVIAAVTAGAACAAIAVGLAGGGHHGKPDYRDSVQLARAVRADEQAKDGGASGAACGRIAAGHYVCSVAFSDLTQGSYQVTVTPDGSGYTVSP